jgi:hypothetical protein
MDIWACPCTLFRLREYVQGRRAAGFAIASVQSTKPDGLPFACLTQLITQNLSCFAIFVIKKQQPKLFWLLCISFLWAFTYFSALAVSLA